MSFWEGRSVLVTGSEGLIGISLCRLLRKQNAWVLEHDIEVSPLHDILRYDRLLDSMQNIRAHGPLVVIHLAAVSGVIAAREEPLRSHTLNIMGTLNVLEACRQVGVDAVVVATSNHVYGEQPLAATNELAALNDLDTYSVGKICADYLARSFGHVYGVPTAIVRNTNCYGPMDQHLDHLIPGAIKAILDGKAPELRSDGNTSKGYLYVDDVAEAYLAIAEYRVTREESGQVVFNVASEPITAGAVVYAILKLMGSNLEPVWGEERHGHDERLFDGKMRHATGWRPRHTLEEGLEKTIEGFRIRYERVAA